MQIQSNKELNKEKKKYNKKPTQMQKNNKNQIKQI